jgi:two-component system, LytTR family, sensor kinase
MPSSLANYEPLLINTVGHSAGALIFGIFLYLFLRDGKGARLGRSAMPAMAAALAMLWNLGSLIVLACAANGSGDTETAAAFSFIVLSLLPAVLFNIALQGKLTILARAGYFVSASAVLLHVAEIFAPYADLHELGLLLVSVGFGALTAIAVAMLSRQGHSATFRARQRILGAMSLFLLATSFLHFGGTHAHAWSEEIALHHAGIPIALFVLLQDYRFLLLDAFVRFLASTILAVAMTAGAIGLDQHLHIVKRASTNGFAEGLLIVGACLGLILFSQLRVLVQHWLTHVVFRRPALDREIQRMLAASDRLTTERETLDRSARAIAEFAGAERYELRQVANLSSDPGELLLPQLVTTTGQWGLTPEDRWVQAIVPFRFSRGDAGLLLLGRRAGGRRYLSEDLQNLTQLSFVVAGQVERCRSGEMQRLASEAEMRALQAQINPHFLFNSLNALYGTIPRHVEGARRTVLNLAEIFRYFLQTDKALIPISEEIRIVKAYLEIEMLRLGDRLETEIVVDEEAASVQIPALCIQPLVENAIKHGVAQKTGPGKVQVAIRSKGPGLEISVSDTGGGFDPDRELQAPSGSGVGFQNVRQRLKLCFGDRSSLRVDSGLAGTIVSFFIPVSEIARHEIRSAANLVR